MSYELSLIKMRFPIVLTFLSLVISSSHKKLRDGDPHND